MVIVYMKKVIVANTKCLLCADANCLPNLCKLILIAVL